MFSNFEPLRGLEPRTHALRMRNMGLKISELEWMMKNLYRNKTKKNKLLYLLFRLGFWGAGLDGVGLVGEVGGWGFWIGGFIFDGLAGAGLAGEVGGYGLGL